MAKLPTATWKLVAGAVLAFGTIASLASASGSVKPGVHNGVITVCIEPPTKGNKATSGDLNVIHCSFKKLSWNIPSAAPAQQAPKGRQGGWSGRSGWTSGRCWWRGRRYWSGWPRWSGWPAGPAGPAGAAGAAGPAGPAGPYRTRRSWRGRNAHTSPPTPASAAATGRMTTTPGRFSSSRKTMGRSKSFVTYNGTFTTIAGVPGPDPRRVSRPTADGWRKGNDHRLRCRGRDGRRVPPRTRPVPIPAPGPRYSRHSSRLTVALRRPGRSTRVGISVRRGC